MSVAAPLWFGYFWILLDIFFNSFLKPETVKSHFHCTSKISTSFFGRRTDVPCSVLYLQMNAYLAESLTKQLSIAQLFGQPFWNEFVGAKKFPTSALLSPSLRRMRMVGFGGAIEDISQDCTTAATQPVTTSIPLCLVSMAGSKFDKQTSSVPLPLPQGSGQ